MLVEQMADARAASDVRKVGAVHVQVLGGGTWDLGAPGLLLTCERNQVCSYLINCSEGTQRFCFEHKLRVAGKLRRVLLTRLTWDAVGGLPGLLLTMSDAGHAGSLHVHGPRHTSQLVSSFGRVLPRDSLPQPAEAQDAEGIWMEESGITALPLLLDPSAASGGGLEDAITAATPLDGTTPACAAGAGGGTSAVPEASPMAGGASDGGAQSRGGLGDHDRAVGAPALKRARHDGSAATGVAAAEPHAAEPYAAEPHAARACAGLQPGQSGREEATGAQAICWLLWMPAQPQKFSPEAALRLGVRKGPLFGRLCAGHAVQLPDGTEASDPALEAEGGGGGWRVGTSGWRVGVG